MTDERCPTCEDAMEPIPDVGWFCIACPSKPRVLTTITLIVYDGPRLHIDAPDVNPVTLQRILSAAMQRTIAAAAAYTAKLQERHRWS